MRCCLHTGLVAIGTINMCGCLICSEVVTATSEALAVSDPGCLVAPLTRPECLDLFVQRHIYPEAPQLPPIRNLATVNSTVALSSAASIPLG